MQKKVAVIGAGVFGITIACKLAEKFDVHLYERFKDILQEASSINQFRLHRGYHYPRSVKTARSAVNSSIPFGDIYSGAVISHTKTYYAIAKEKSKTTPKDYLNFLKKMQLDFGIVDLKLINRQKVALTLLAEENLIDFKKLKSIAKRRLEKAKVKLHLNKSANREIKENYDYVVICTYSNINEILLPKDQEDYQYEVCEKLVLELPDKYKNKSIVVLDGPFMCIDPYGRSKYHLMGNVVHAIHATNVGKFPKVPNSLKPYLNKGLIKGPTITNFDKFIKSASEFIPGINSAKHVGSMFTVRTVLPNKDKTDERPTIVKRIDKKTFTVFSGKISSCVIAAQDVYDMLSN